MSKVSPPLEQRSYKPFFFFFCRITTATMSLCIPCYRTLAEGHSGRIHGTIDSFLAAVTAECCICRGLFCQLPVDKQQQLNNFASPEISPRIWLRFPSYAEKYKYSFVQHPEPGTVTSYERDWDYPSPSAGCIRLTFKILTPEELHVVTHSTPLSTLATLLRVPRVGPVSLLNWGSNVEFWRTAPSIRLTPIKSKVELGTNPRPWSIRSGSTFSKETVDKIKTWRKTCADTHKDCNVRREATKKESLKVQWLPTRLVEIITPDQDGYYPSRNTACRIVETKSDNIPTPLEYITLSHRWNEYNVEILERDKLPQWKIEIPLTVSKTFRDAFKVAQKLEISYIWIDSLCIIQGEEDGKDWKIEAPQMDKVYANAEFNICASLGENMEGLFPPQERVTANLLMSEIWIAPESTSSGQEDHSSDNDDQDCGYDPSGSFLVSKYKPGAMWKQSMAMSPLKDRGWIFQEELLSFANLHFGPNEVLFECLEMRASESLGMDKDYPVNYDNWDFVTLKSRLPKEQGSVIGDKSDDKSSNYDDPGETSCSLDSANEYYEDPPNIYQQWYSLLSTYSARQLTYHKDRLIAMSEVARYVKGFIPDGDIYIAGLWCSRLATDMLWRRPERAVVTEDNDWALWRERSTDLSFSWLSIFGEIEQSVPDPENITDKAKVECILKGSKDQPFVEDLFSVEGPTPIEMKVTGHLRQISLKPQSRGDDKKLILVFSKITVRRDMIKSIHIIGDGRLDFNLHRGELASLNENALFSIPLASTADGNIYFLLLLLVDSEEGTFRRIGVYEGYPYEKLLYCDEGVYNQEMQNGWPLKPLHELPCWRYDEVTKQHTIFVT